jgi:hypothetical protein
VTVNDVNRETKVVVGARVPPDLAAAVVRLADAGNRTLSREVAAAIAEHVQRASLGTSSPLPLLERAGSPSRPPALRLGDEAA